MPKKPIVKLTNLQKVGAKKEETKVEPFLEAMVYMNFELKLKRKVPSTQDNKIDIQSDIQEDVDEIAVAVEKFVKENYPDYDIDYDGNTVPHGGEPRIRVKDEKGDVDIFDFY